VEGILMSNFIACTTLNLAMLTKEQYVTTPMTTAEEVVTVGLMLTHCAMGIGFLIWAFTIRNLEIK
jgi:hypothetical protein